MIYLDWAASAPLNKKIMDQCHETSLRVFGNPSSIHFQGREADKIIQQSRQALASALHCLDSEIVFTSGGTEANNLALFSLLKNGRNLKSLENREVIVSGVEHPAVFKPAQSLENFGIKLRIINADKDGRVDPGRIEEALNSNTLMVSLMSVNNETGAIQPLMAVADILKTWNQKGGRRVLFHSDMVQALGKIPINLEKLPVDMASFSAHKMGGPKGVGALFLRRNLQLNPFYQGGEQENSKRPGTENLMGIHALGLLVPEVIENVEALFSTAQKKMAPLISALRKIEGARLIPDSRNPDSKDFSPYVLKFSMPPVPGEVVVRVMEDNGFLISTGSACSNKELEKKYRVLKNMGLPFELAASSLRVSMGPTTSEDDLLLFAEAFKKEIPSLVKLARFM
ncbi:MAG: cysteine desulfurase [Spirochaetales bacterium]|nr:cysteine desulfurase [Spirochaetales bacterium]